ncbi:virulence factor SrfC family protein [Desulfovibrio sp. ZJ200]|uniref:virulence factor SrfC family protein n=1 Tax=Desulfovibrio sp. ZJ200 TaxID=2709792 RepID=UPI0013ECB817|nr:virulence factor SrfC family protein [Desulfovibrio sp. ZJ200]
MQQQDHDLAQHCRELADASRQAVDWLRDNCGLVGSECAALQKDMRRAARFFNKCEQAARRKMCVGVFGPSQSGKSYLISALAKDAKGALTADLGGKTYDFLTEINPEGGKESTGLVTRFTTTPPAGLADGFPIRLRLLSETDVARVLANTYYADCEHKQAPQPEALIAALDDLAGRAAVPQAGAGVVSEDDLEDLREYVNKNFSSRPRVQMLQKGYWRAAAELAPRLGLADRAALLGLIWDNVPEFQSLYLKLCGALEKLGNPAEAACPIEALIPRSVSIIDVTLLRGLADETPATLPILGANGRRTELPRAVITALTAEITIPMREKPDDFFDHTDLLDFPGYRSRLKLSDLNNELQRPGTLENLFLRGKVAYLFERYCEEKELTSMLLCIGPGNQEVQDLPRAVYEWICSTHGEKPVHRAGRPPALFFVLTKMDMEFEKKNGAPSVEKRWDIRLQSSLLDFFGKQHDWPENWDGSKPFANVFLLRNPNFRSEAIFSFDKETHQETGVRPEQKEYVEEVRRAFLQSALVQRHVSEPERVWQAAMRLNDGGVALLREKLRPLCNPELKRRQITVSLAEKREQVLACLGVFYKSDDSEELRRQKEQLSRTLVALLARVAEKQLFGEFLQRLQVRDFDLYEICFNARQSPAQEAAALPADVVGTRVSADDILGDIFGDAPPPAPAPAEATESSARDTAAVFAGLALEHWISRLRELAGDAEARSRYGLPARELDQFCHELIAAAGRCRVRENLESELRRGAAYSNMARERLVWKQVSLAADAINAFVDWLGFDPRFKDQAARTIFFGGRSLSLFAPPPAISGEPQIAEEESPYDRLWYTDWLRALAYAVIANVNFDGEQTVNPEQNNRLRHILQIIKE